MQLPTVATILAFAGLGLALPTVDQNPKPRAVDHGITVALLEEIMPLSVSCDGRGDECATATLAAPYLHQSMLDYNVNTAVEKAGILSLIAYESVEMQYRRNTKNAAAGQGTANQQMGDNNLAYAAALGYSVTTATVLDLVSNNTFNFGSGAWYYTAPAQDSKCQSTRTMAQASGNVDADAWFASYLDTCVIVPTGWNTSEPGRWTYWESAKAAYSIS